MGLVDVVIVVAAVHHLSWAVARARRRKRLGHFMGWAKRPIRSPHLLGRSPARSIIFRVDGSRAGPARQNFISWAAVQPGPSIFRMTYSKMWVLSRTPGSPSSRRRHATEFRIEHTEQNHQQLIVCFIHVEYESYNMFLWKPYCVMGIFFFVTYLLSFYSTAPTSKISKPKRS